MGLENSTNYSYFENFPFTINLNMYQANSFGFRMGLYGGHVFEQVFWTLETTFDVEDEAGE